MKKVLLSAAFVFTFAFAQANEDIGKNENVREKVTANQSKKEVVNNTVVNSFDFECFATTCGVVVCGTWVGGEPTNEDRVEVMEALEEYFCE